MSNWIPGTREFEGLVDRITDRVVSQLSEAPATTPFGMHISGRGLPPATLLREAPDRLGCFPFAHEIDRPEVREEARLAAEIAGIIDHTLLKPDATPRDIERLCEEAHRFRFKSVCVNPSHVALAARTLRGSGVLVCAVVGFPLGATLSDVKAYETRRALEEGAQEIDMVLPIGMLKAGLEAQVTHDILEVVEAAGTHTVVKVILETCLLDDREKRLACRAARAAGARFVKTSTGFSTGGATPEDIRLMRDEVGPTIGVKASGGIRSIDDALEMMHSGATRLGVSASVAIVTGSRGSSRY